MENSQEHHREIREMGAFAVDLLMALLMGTLATQYQQMGWAADHLAGPF